MQSSQATVHTILSDTPEFDLRIARMGELVDPCDAQVSAAAYVRRCWFHCTTERSPTACCTVQMLILTQCLNDSGGNKDACADACTAMRECHRRRDAALLAIDGKCGPAQSAYEGCMRASAADPTRCIELLDMFLACAESATSGPVTA